MTKHRTTTRAAVALVLAAAAATTAYANDDLYWQGGPGELAAANYFDATTNTPNIDPGTGNNLLYLGGNSAVTNTTGDISVFRIRVGHNLTGGGATGLPGPATLTLSAGTTTVRSGAAGVASAGVLVGVGEDGTLNLDGATLSVNRDITVGYGGDPTKNANLNITNGGTLTVTQDNLGLGDAPTGQTGIAGHVTLDSGSISVLETGADMVVGVQAGSSFTQNGGTVSIADATFVGRRNADNSSFTLTGGTFTAGGGFTVADNGSAAGAPDTVSVTLSGGTLNITSNFNVAIASGTTGVIGASGTTLNISGTADVNVGAPGTTSNVFIGRGTTDHTTFNMTGGTLDVAQHFLMGTGNQQTANDPHTVTTPTNIVGNHSAGTITTGSNFVLADAGGQTTYNLSGTGAINAGGTLFVGRQLATGIMNQTGGSVTANAGVHIGDSFTTDPTLDATGTYNVSGGTINATVPAGSTADALAIAPAGTGTLHITGDGATINVTGNMAVYANTNGGTNVGTLAYTLEAGEPLTEINVTGTATFSLGSILSFDLNGTTPTQPSYDLLTAADIIDNGLTFSAPTGWNFQIVAGGNGEILQAIAIIADNFHDGDTNNDRVVDLTDLNNVLNNFGSTGVNNPGDDDGNGVVDLTDLNDVLNNFGTVYTSLNVVPEPASLSLLALGATSLLARRRRSR